MPDFGQTGFAKGRFAGCAPAFGREEEDCFLLSQRLPLQRAEARLGPHWANLSSRLTAFGFLMGQTRAQMKQTVEQHLRDRAPNFHMGS
jgi:hypothetical protein